MVRWFMWGYSEELILFYDFFYDKDVVSVCALD